MNLINSKLYLISIFIGLFAGVMCIPFRWIVSRIAAIRPYIFNDSNQFISHIGIFIAIFFSLLFVAFLVKIFPKISGSGLPQTQALLYEQIIYNKPFKYLIIKFIGGIIALCSGLSLGREGTSVQMGSLTGYLAGDMFKVKPGRRRHLIAAGAGAGISAAFTAPLSSSVLILESLQKFTLPQTIICTLLAGLTSGIMAKLIIPENIYDNINIIVPSVAEWKLIIVFFIAAIYFSLLGKIFSIALIKGKKLYSQWSTHLEEESVSIENRKTWKKVQLFFIKSRVQIFQAFFLSCITWIIGFFYPTIIGGDQTFLISQVDVAGAEIKISGFEFLQHIHRHWNTIIYILFLSITICVISIFTIISNSSGYPGGIFLPMMTVGGLSGKLFYELFHLTATLSGFDNLISTDLSGYFIMIGMSAFFIAVVRTPITGFILIAEMTGRYEAFFPILVVGILVYYFTQLLKVAPMNDLLYKFIIENSKDLPLKTIIYLEVEANSYLDGKTVSTVALPDGCEIQSIIRDNRQIYTNTGKQDEQQILHEDQIGISLNTEDIGKIYQPLVSMSI